MATGYESYRSSPDWWSRWMSIGSLIVAAATLLWAYSRLQNVPTQDELAVLVDGRVENAERQLASRLAEREPQPDPQTVEQLAELRQDLGTVRARQQQLIVDVQSQRVARVERPAGAADGPPTALSETADTEATSESAGPALGNPSRANEALADSQPAPGGAAAGRKPDDRTDENGERIDISTILAEDRGAAGSPADDTTSPAPAASDVEKMASDATAATPDTASADATADAAPADERPTLLLVRSALKPSADGQQLPAVTVKTLAPEGIQVTALEFSPRQVIESPVQVSVADVVETKDSAAWYVVFTSDDNRASSPELQGKYFRQLEAPYAIPQDMLRSLTAIIDNPEHAGFGLEGSLTIHYGDSQSLTIDGYQLLFAQPEAETASDVDAS